MGEKTLTRRGRKRSLTQVLRQDGAYLLMVAIPIAYFVIFKYAPMLGLNIAFRDYRVGGSVFSLTEDFVGLRWFSDFFASPFAWRVIRNTVVLSLEVMAFTFPLPIVLALMFNEVRSHRFRGIAQTISYLPHFLSIAVVVGIMTNMFSVNGGVVNDFLNALGIESIDFMQSSRWFRTMYVGSSLWMQLGFSTIIYTAAIAGVDPCLYEAAYVDGSTRLKNIFLITLPSIAPTIIILFILDFGRLMSVGYEKVLLMYSPVSFEKADIISTFVYRNGIQQGRFGLATAVDLFNSGINLVLMLVTNRAAKKLTDTSVF